MIVKDRFRDWNLYHKAIVVSLGAAILWIVAWAVIVYDGAFEFEHEETLPYSAEAIWPWLIQDDERPRWTAELVDVGRLAGQAGVQDTTRLLFWRQGYKRWQAVERITGALPNRLLEAVQESDIDQRWLSFELEPLGPCETRVISREVIRPLNYKDRFWFFRKTDLVEERLVESSRALQRWVADEAPTCLIE